MLAELGIYKSVRVEVEGCTIFDIPLLQRRLNGIVLKFGYRNKLFCPYTPQIRITSTLKDPSSSVSVDAIGRQIRAIGTQWAVSRNQDNTLLIGVERGLANVTYLSNSVSIPSGYYIQSNDGRPLGNPQLASPPDLMVVFDRGKGIFRFCTTPDNIIVAKKADTSLYQISNIKLHCLEGSADTVVTVKNPLGQAKNWLIRP